MKITVVGLGKMGYQIALKLQHAGHEVLGVIRHEERIAELENDGIHATVNREDAVSFHADEQAIIWLMIPSDAVDEELSAWLAVLPENSIIIDGGNSDFRRTKQRSSLVSAKNMHLLDVGTSGGVHGLENGFSMMAGGPQEAYATITPFLDVLAAPRGAHQYFSGSGSGHYVKMVHNAIEYGMMESLAEGYRMLHEGAYKNEIDLAATGEVWQHSSVVTSWLNQLSQEALAENPTLEGIDGYVAESGEARWTLENARDLGIELPSIQAAFDVRIASGNGQTHFGTKLLAAMRYKFGGHSVNKS